MSFFIFEDLFCNSFNKNNIDLTGYRKIYFDNKRYRVVYKIVEQEVIIYIISIGKRDKMDVYKKAGDRK